MEVKICDRCGDFCNDEKCEITYEKYIKKKKVLFSGEEIIHDFHGYDLCSKCASEFEKWLECEEDNNASDMG